MVLGFHPFRILTKTLFLGIEECVRNNSFSFDETLKYSSLGENAIVDLKNRTFWKSTVHTTMYGICHTLVFPDPVGADMLDDLVYFSLDPNLRYEGGRRVGKVPTV